MTQTDEKRIHDVARSIIDANHFINGVFGKDVTTRDDDRVHHFSHLELSVLVHGIAYRYPSTAIETSRLCPPLRELTLWQKIKQKLGGVL